MKSQDICEQITAAIIAELEKGVMPCLRSRFQRSRGRPAGYPHRQQDRGPHHRGRAPSVLGRRACPDQ